ncbi:DegQ family serine endoprotease [Pelagibaculum spongiae]|uniref:Serine endoprotease DegQ n=1 Tax=Pelagibaculum spongiae TaxID=2080658 RepID=A0A2V1H563_9GAMM|nr:DegQ family serine endoprotease [Pelagibaculum spongiae]PVZ71905.1 serine endoprotease DegQ [Pelagibaculum spongiae]
MQKLLACFILVFTSVVGTSGAAQAALPLAVDGEQIPSLAPMLERSTPAVVNIATRSKAKSSSRQQVDPFEFFFGPNARRPRQEGRPTQSLGSGVVIDAENGYILTNNHVIDKADEIKVTLRDGRELDAKLIGGDPDSDVAVIQVEAKNLTAIPLSNSDSLRVGDFVVAIGNPFGLGQTVTSGIVSALGRSGLGIEGYEDFIQTDASINPGNSGGALVNLRGELVGINTAIIAPGGGNVGIGFAIPINMAKSLTDQLVKHGEVQRGILGVQIGDFTAELQPYFDTDVDYGALVQKVFDNTGAKKAGLQKDDIIIAVDGKKVKDGAQLRNSIGLLRSGTKVKVTYIRDGKKKIAKVVIQAPEQKKSRAETIHPQLAGAILKARDEEITEGVQGVEISQVERFSPAWNQGLRPGDIIYSVNRRGVNSIKQLGKIAKRSQSELLLNVIRGRGSFYLLLK